MSQFQEYSNTDTPYLLPSLWHAPREATNGNQQNQADCQGCCTEHVTHPMPVKNICKTSVWQRGDTVVRIIWKQKAKAAQQDAASSGDKKGSDDEDNQKDEIEWAIATIPHL